MHEAGHHCVPRPILEIMRVVQGKNDLLLFEARLDERHALPLSRHYFVAR